jgi:hypothetical protein
MKAALDNDHVTLDPQDWEESGALALAMIDDTLDYLRDLRERPVWQPMPQAVRCSFDEPLAQGGIGAAGAMATSRRECGPTPTAISTRAFGAGCREPEPR